MSFLSAAFLLALPLVAVPVAIHLYRGRQRDVVLWGAMQFLTRAVTKGRRWERLEELLLMGLRFAAVAALVLALARPMVSSAWFGYATDREVILVLDNSLSMSREVAGESSTDRMREEALKVIDSLSATDGVQVLLAAGNEWLTAEAIPADASGKRRFREVIHSVEPTQGGANLLECLQDAVHLQSADRPTARQVVVFTDGQAKSWQTDAAAAWRRLAADRDAASFPITISVVECGVQVAQVENLAVTQINTTRNLVRPGEQVELTAEIHNTGDVPTGASVLEWLLADEVVQESPLESLEPRAKTQASASLRLEQPGVVAITCRIRSTDQLPLDGENTLVMEVADELPVLFVHNDSAGGSTIPAVHLFAAALGFDNDRPQRWHSIYRPETLPASSLANHSLADYRAIVLNDVPDVDRAAIERLESFVRAGGGLWLALGEAIDRTDFNRDWYSDGDGLSPIELDAFVILDNAEDAAATIHPPSRDHPATVQLANTTQLDIDQARIRERWLFAERAEADRAAPTLLEAGDGQPLVTEKFVGQGRVLVQAYPLGMEWTNLPLLKVYVVMIQDWLDYVTAPRTARHNLAPGTALVASPPKDAAAHAATLVTPRGDEVPLIATDGDAAPVYRYSQTRLPGTYRVRFSGDGVSNHTMPFHVARDPAESDLRRLSEADRAGLLTPAGVTWAEAAGALPRFVETVPRREPFWGVLLTALVVLLAGELFLSNWLARQRSGFTVSAT